MSAVRAGRAFIDVGLRSTVERDLRRVTNAFSAFGANITRIGTGITAVGAAIFAPFAAGTTVFAGLDDELRQAAAIAGASQTQFLDLTNSVRELGRTTSFTATQVATGATVLARAGFDVPAIDVALPNVLNLARAAGTELATAGQIAANTLRSFQLPVEALGAVSDSLLVTANSSTQTIEDLGEALKFIGIDAASAGVSLNDVNAALGILANLGLRGSLAGTSIRRILTNLTNQDNIDRLELEFGIVISDDSLADFSGTLADILEQARGLSNVQRQALFFELFDARAKGAAAALADFQGDFRALRNELDNSGGTTARVAQQLDAGIGGSFRLLISAVQDLGIALANAVSGDIIRLADGITGIVRQVINFVEQNQELVRTLAAVSAGIIGVGGAIAGLSISITAVSTGFNLLIGFATTIGGVLSPLVGLVGRVIAAFVSVSGSVFGGFAFAVNPVTAVATAVGALLASILGFTESGRSLVGSFFTFFQTQIGVVTDAIGGIVGAIGNGDLGLAANIALEAVRAAFLNALAFVAENWDSWLEDLGNALIEAFNGFLQIGSNVIAALLRLFLSPLQFIRRALTVGLQDALNEVFNNVFNVSVDFDNGVAESFRQAADVSNNRLQNLIRQASRGSEASNNLEETAENLSNAANDLEDAATSLNDPEAVRAAAAARQAAEAELDDARRRAEQLTGQFADPIQAFTAAFNEADSLVRRELLDRNIGLNAVIDAAQNLANATSVEELQQQLTNLVQAGRISLDQGNDVFQQALATRANQFNQSFLSPLDQFISSFNEADLLLSNGLTDQATAFRGVEEAAQRLANDEGIEGLRQALNGLISDGALQLDDANRIFNSALRSRADEVLTSIQTPEAALQAAVDELVLLRDQGFLNADQFREAARIPAEEFLNATQQAGQTIRESFDVRSFANSFSALRGGAFFSSRNDDDSNRETAANTAETNRLLQQIIDNPTNITLGP